eukprot:m.4839 g.4839  ORF g.4839 m.4839 type:complete len:301 (-) comp4658_c0_seq2:186-1088(-)
MSKDSNAEGVVPAGNGAKVMYELLGGTVGGVLQVLVGHPLDTVKVRMQGSTQYRSAWHCLSSSVKTNGVRSLYNGMSSPLVMAGINNSVIFSVNGQMKRFVGGMSGKSPGELGKIEQLAAAWMTAPIYALTLTPTELVKSRLQFASERTSVIKALRDCVRQDGVLGLYRGYTATVGTRLVGLPFYFVTYDTTKKYIRNSFETHTSFSETTISQLTSMTAGGLAGMAFWTGNFPVDTIRTRVMTSSTPMSILLACKTIWQDGGVLAFYRGYSAAILRAFPANAVAFYGVEMTLKAFNQQDF